MQKSITIMTIAILIAAVTIAMPQMALANHDGGNQKSQDNKAKAEKCNNVKILLKVDGVTNTTETIDASITLNGKTLTKSVDVDQEIFEEEGEDTASITIPFQFKKQNPCPKVGDDFTVTVNGVTANGELASVKKANKATINLA